MKRSLNKGRMLMAILIAIIGFSTAKADELCTEWELSSIYATTDWSVLDNSDTIELTIPVSKTFGNSIHYTFDSKWTITVTYSDGLHHAPTVIDQNIYSNGKLVFGDGSTYHPTKIEFAMHSFDGLLYFDSRIIAYSSGSWRATFLNDGEPYANKSYTVNNLNMSSETLLVNEYNVNRAYSPVLTITGNKQIRIQYLNFRFTDEASSNLNLPMEEALYQKWSSPIEFYDDNEPFTGNLTPEQKQDLSLSLEPLFETHEKPEDINDEDIAGKDAYYVEEMTKAELSEDGRGLTLTAPCSGRYQLTMKYKPAANSKVRGEVIRRIVALEPDKSSFKLNGQPADKQVLNLKGYGDISNAKLEIEGLWDTEIYYKLSQLTDIEEMQIATRAEEPTLEGYTKYDSDGIDLTGAKSLSLILKKNDVLSGPHYYLYDTTGSTTSVDTITSESDDVEVYYDLQGRCLSDYPAAPGIYVIRKGNKATKIRI